MKFALDSNILVYASGVDGRAKQKVVFEVLQTLPPMSVVIPAQALGELFNVLIRKASRSMTEASKQVLYWYETYAVIGTSADTMLAALDVAARHRLQIWDAVILAAVAEAECRCLLSEDMQDGFMWNDVTVVNPFLKNKHPLLIKFLSK